MDNGIMYICECPHVLENTMRGIRKALRKQTKFNKGVAIFALSMIVYTAITEMNNWELKNKVEKLYNEIEELKRKKGE